MNRKIIEAKKRLRHTLKSRRAELSLERREEACRGLIDLFLPSLKCEDVLSFASFHDEIDTSLLNHHLAEQGRLLLPKRFGDQLKIFRVQNFPSSFSSLFFEPNSLHCEEVELGEIKTILVPGLGFDRSNHRIGYGKGFYDRFLARVPQAQMIGIGFKEQSVPELPIMESDFPLTKVSLF